MPLPVRSFCRGVLIAGATLFATSAFAQMELKIIAPAAPGGAMIFNSICANAEVANKVAPAISTPRQKPRTGNDMSTLLKTPQTIQTIKGWFCWNVQCSVNRLWPNP